MEPMPSPLAAVAKNVVDECLGVKPGEVVTILTDSENDEHRRIARSFWEAAREKGAEPILVEMLPRGTSGEEPPFTIAALMALSDVLLCPTTKTLHTRERGKRLPAGMYGSRACLESRKRWLCVV